MNWPKKGTDAGTGLDILAVEPPPEDHPLTRAKNCCIPPHIAWGILQARRRLMDIAMDNVRSYLVGSPQNMVN